MPPSGESVLGHLHRAFIQQGVSILIASRDGSNRPCVCRASGCSVRDDGRVLVFLDENRGRRVLGAVVATNTVAVVFSEPPTHRTIQVKGTDATVVMAEDHSDVIGAYAAAFADMLTDLGYSARMATALVQLEPTTARAVLFTPTSVFDQTPGPGAGEAVSAVP